MMRSVREKEAVLKVFAALMRPLARVAFDFGITANEISRVLRRTYLQALEVRLLEQKRPTTDARLAAVAGLSRADVTALREAIRADAPHSLGGGVSLDQVVNLLTVWHTHSSFVGAYGLAQELDLVRTAGSPRRNFRELVAIACPGTDEERLLDALTAAGSVEIIDSITIRCLSRTFLPNEADLKRIEWGGRILENVAASWAYNVLRDAPEPAYLARAVICDELISEAGRDKFLTLASERSHELLAEMDTFLTGLASTEGSASGKRYGMGIYLFEDQHREPGRPVSSSAASGCSTLEEEIDVLAGIDRLEANNQ